MVKMLGNLDLFRHGSIRNEMKLSDRNDITESIFYVPKTGRVYICYMAHRRDGRCTYGWKNMVVPLDIIMDGMREC